jgi:hypothetical protein
MSLVMDVPKCAKDMPCEADRTDIYRSLLWDYNYVVVKFYQVYLSHLGRFKRFFIYDSVVVKFINFICHILV